MPEGNEISFLRKYLLDFFPRLQKWLSKEALNRPLELVKIWTDVWSKFPPDIQAQLSNKHDNWETFIAALCSLPLTSTISRSSSEPWSLPSECKLAVALTQYCPPTWRGKDPDPNRVVPDPHLVLEGSTEKEISAVVARCTKYYDFLCLQSTKLHESLSDLIEKRGWDDKPPTCIKKLLAQAPEEVWRVLTECAELKLGLAERLSKAINTDKHCGLEVAITDPRTEQEKVASKSKASLEFVNCGNWLLRYRKSLFLWLGLKQTWSRPLSNRLGDAALAGGDQRKWRKGSTGTTRWKGRTWWSKGRTCCIKPEDTCRTDGRVQTMAGISSQLAKFGVAKKKDLKSTTSTHPDISGPHISFPYSTRRVCKSRVVFWTVDNNLKICQVELLLHTTPQIYTTKQWLGVARTPDSKRGFKVVIALEFKTHVLAFLSRDNNARVGN
ncbi:hypothetical protein C8F04DRAFT_1246058 [Mycena alexandri]|uniref:Uncharacterized protein n=1 Tax=Mycena alexandri TaxID=1745969 RepID=A0AAD6WLX1_9AGAR|nr:hypothetical protein C8F04DRAFT_1246058 [Mycena alexandri]